MGSGGLGFPRFLFRWVFVPLGFSRLIIGSNWFDGLCVCGSVLGLMVCVCMCVCVCVCVCVALCVW